MVFQSILLHPCWKFLHKLSLEDDQYQFSHIPRTADGASVNFGKHAGGAYANTRNTSMVTQSSLC